MWYKHIFSLMVSPLNYLSLFAAFFQAPKTSGSLKPCQMIAASDLKGTVSVGRQPGSSEMQGLLATSASSAFHGEFGEHVLEGHLQPPSRFVFILPPTSKEKSRTLQKPFHKLSQGAEGVAHRKLPLLLWETLFPSVWCYSQNHTILCVQKFFWQQMKQWQ